MAQKFPECRQVVSVELGDFLYSSVINITLRDRKYPEIGVFNVLLSTLLTVYRDNYVMVDQVL
jgi:hypothetical protein